MGWIQSIASSIETMFNALRVPLGLLPPILLLCEVFKRPGLSCLSLTSAIIKGLEMAGIPTGVNNDGSMNFTNMLVKTIACSVIDELKNNAVVEGVIAPGQIPSFGTGGGPMGPVSVFSYNLLSTSNIRGIVR